MSLISRKAQFQQWCAEQSCRNNGFVTFTHISYSLESSGCLVSRLWAGLHRNPAVILGRRKRFFGSPKCPYCARVKNLFIYTSVSPSEFTAWYIIKHRGSSPFTFIPILARLYSFHYTQTSLVCIVYISGIMGYDYWLGWLVVPGVLEYYVAHILRSRNRGSRLCRKTGKTLPDNMML